MFVNCESETAWRACHVIISLWTPLMTIPFWQQPNMNNYHLVTHSNWTPTGALHSSFKSVLDVVIVIGSTSETALALPQLVRVCLWGVVDMGKAKGTPLHQIENILIYLNFWGGRWIIPLFARCPLIIRHVMRMTRPKKIEFRSLP